MKKISLAIAAALAVLFAASVASADAPRPRIKFPAVAKHQPKPAAHAPRIRLHPRIKMMRVPRATQRPLRYSR